MCRGESFSLLCETLGGRIRVNNTQKEVDAWVKQELRKQGFRSRPARPQEMFGPYKVLWYWWHPERLEEQRGR